MSIFNPHKLFNCLKQNKGAGIVQWYSAGLRAGCVVAVARKLFVKLIIN